MAERPDHENESGKTESEMNAGSNTLDSEMTSGPVHMNEGSIPTTDAGQATMEEELAAMRDKANETQDRLLRLAAEFENYKKRIERETNNSLKFAEENILRELLPSLDNLTRAIEQGEESHDVNALVEGVKMTRDGLMATLEKFGVQALDSVGKPFDPNYHEALTMEPSEDMPDNHVIREFQKGYMFKDRLIRAAKVIVSKGVKNA